MPMKFYCHSCKIFLSKSDVKKRKVLDGSGDTKCYCPKCDAYLDRVCETCANGIMEIPKHPILGDYNLDGYLDQFCTLCGHGFAVYSPYSKRKIKKKVDLIFTVKGLSYHEKKEFLKELFTKCKSEDTAMLFIQNKFPQ